MCTLRIIFGLYLILCNTAYAQSVHQWDIVINELLPDPSPSVGLPNSEFIELRNVSAAPINLRNWKITDGTSTCIINANVILQKDSLVIICANASSAAFQPFGAVIGVAGFPSLNNDADIIALYSSEGKLIHAVGYTSDWFQNGLKSEGGWSLEMIDSKNPCAEFSNWRASENLIGGSPGKENSIAKTNTDELMPGLMRTYTVDSLMLIAVFDESLDSSSVVNSHFEIESHHIKQVQTIGPLNKQVLIKLSEPLTINEIITLTVNSVSDCAGNIIHQLNKAKVGLPSGADSVDIVINEILFNPSTDGYDYVELYNRSKKIIDLQSLILANKSTTGALSNQVRIQSSGWLFFPGEFIVVCENKKWLLQHYIAKKPDVIIEVSDLISLPDDKGHFVLQTNSGNNIDDLSYDQNWHFALLNDREGVSLERLSDTKPTQDPANWSSAASDAGYGTPGYQNSQVYSGNNFNGSISVTPKIFSPNFDGRDDYAFIEYRLDRTGYVGTVTIHDSYGRIVRTLLYNQTLSVSGQWRWDGLNDQNFPLSAGVYVVLTELFDISGKRKRFKNTVVIAKPIQ